MAESAKVCRHVHLPLQSGSNAMLRKMRRQYTRERYLDIVAEIRQAMPGVGLTTDIITGFVGETEQDFQDTLSLVDQVGFDQAFMFSYSPREGTPAHAEPETLTPEEKQDRHERLMAVQNRHTERNLDAMVGRSEDILVEDRATRSAVEWFGKTSCFKRVNVRAAPGIAKGDMVKVRILARTGLVLQAEAEPGGGDGGRRET